MKNLPQQRKEREGTPGHGNRQLRVGGGGLTGITFAWSEGTQKREVSKNDFAGCSEEMKGKKTIK